MFYVILIYIYVLLINIYVKHKIFLDKQKHYIKLPVWLYR